MIDKKIPNKGIKVIMVLRIIDKITHIRTKETINKIDKIKVI